MQAQVRFDALNRLLTLDANWLSDVLRAAPQAWCDAFDTDKIVEFWHDERHARADFARQWTLAS